VDPAAALAALVEQSSPAAAPAPEGSGSRVTLQALEGSWVQVSNADRSYLWTRTLQAGESFPVPDQPGLQIWTGNAGGIAVFVDGAPAPPLGSRGTVIRGLSLDPADLMANGAAVPQAKPVRSSPTL
jgi:cytoskeleton protein RodZ